MVLWKARQANIRIGNSVTVVTTQELYDQITGTQYEQIAKNVRVKTPEGGTENVPLLGEDANGYQNEELDRLRRGKGEVTMDLLEGNLDIAQWGVQSTSTSGSAAGFTFYNYGDDMPTTAPAVAIKMADTTIDRTDFLLNNSDMVNIGEMTVDGEGHAVREGVKFECLARDFWEGNDLGN